MTLLDLLKIIDTSESGEMIQICGMDWEDYDTFHTWSNLLKPFHHLKIKTLAAISEDVFRVDLDMEGGELDA